MLSFFIVDIILLLFEVESAISRVVILRFNLVDDDNDDDDDDSVSENRKQKQPCVELRFTMGDFDDTAIAAIEEADDVDNIDMAHFPSITTNSNDDNEGNGNMQEKKRKKPLIQELS